MALLLVSCLSGPPGLDPDLDPGPIVDIDPAPDPGPDPGPAPGPDPDPDPDPGPDPGPDPDPDPEPDPDPGPDPDPEPDPDPGPDPDPEPDPDPSNVYVVTLDAADPTVLAGLELRLTASVEPAFEGELVWASDGGDIVASGLEATFRAPGAAGSYRVSAAVPGELDTPGTVDVTVPGGLLEPFTLIMIPDTQNMMTGSARAESVRRMGEWIVAERDARSIAFVTHVGDVVDDPLKEQEWEWARAGLDALDGVVPYAVAIGDHEYFQEHDKAGSTEAYWTHFGPHRYAGYDWYLGAHVDGLSHAQRFSAGGRDFLHLAVEWEPFGTVEDPSSPLGWAVAMLEAHPNLPTIITTHAYLWDEPGQEGHFPDAAREGFVRVGGTEEYFGASGVALFETLVEPFPQVFMVLNGHYHKAQTDDNGQYHQVSVNEAGSSVYEMLANFQRWARGGDGYLRIIEFVPGGGEGGLDRIQVETYSPRYDRYPDSDLSRFSFDLDFGLRFARP
jgi:hypothetical protein